MLTTQIFYLFQTNQCCCFLNVANIMSSTSLKCFFAFNSELCTTNDNIAFTVSLWKNICQQNKEILHNSPEWIPKSWVILYINNERRPFSHHLCALTSPGLILEKPEHWNNTQISKSIFFSQVGGHFKKFYVEKNLSVNVKSTGVLHLSLTDSGKVSIYLHENVADYEFEHLHSLFCDTTTS